MTNAPFSWFCRPSRLKLPTVLIFFRSNQIFVTIPLALYIILLHAGALLGALPPPANPLEGGLLYQSLFGWAATQPFFSALTAAMLLFIQAVTVNLLADEFRLMSERNWFPGLFYVLAASAFPEFLFVSAPLVAATFVPFALYRIFNAYQKPNVSETIFDGALWIGVASLFCPSALWLLVAAYAAYGLVQVFRLQERFVFLVGAFVPLFLAWLWYFWADRGGDFRSTQWGSLFQVYHFDMSIDTKGILKLGLLCFMLLIFLGGLGSFYARKSIQSQKFVSVLYRFLAVGGASVLLQNELHWERMILPSAAMGIFLSLSFQSIRNRLLAELSHLAILLFIFYIQFADFFLNLTNSIF